MSSNKGTPPKKVGVIKKLYFDTVPFSFRYGKEFQKTYKFLMASQNWSRRKLLEYQNKEFMNLFLHCIDNVPYYKKIFSEYGINKKSISSIADINKIPYLTKELINKNINELYATNLNHLKRYKFSTSGSSGKRLEFYGLDSLYKKEAAFVLRSYKLSGGTLYDKPSVWIRRYVPKNSNLPLHYYDYELKRLYLSAYHLNQENIHKYVDMINSGNYHTLSTYPSSAYVLAQLCKDNNLSLSTIKNIHVASEPLLDEWREEVYNVFNLYPIPHYGQVEKVSFMHQKYGDKCYVDNLEYGVSEYEKNEYGHYDLIATGFINYLMPFLRYRTEDSVIIKDPSNSEGNPDKIEKIVGRSSDILVASNGTKVPGVNFYNWIDNKLPGVGMFQIIQKTNMNVEFNFVPTSQYTETTNEEIIKGLESRLGNLDINIIKKSIIERNKTTGKIKSIINESLN